jgi:hypothetical protein
MAVQGHTSSNEKIVSLGFDLSKRGIAVLVSCDYGDSSPSANEARKEMYTTFKDWFDYDVLEIPNPKSSQIIDKLREVGRFLEEKCKYIKPVNEDGGRKAIVFAFAGKGGFTRRDGDYIVGQDGKNVSVISDVVNAFLNHDSKVIHVPKLFFFDSNRGTEWLYAAPDRGNEEQEVNYRIDYATLPEHRAESDHQWMKLVAQTLRDKKDYSVADVIAEVKKTIYKQKHN